MADEVKIYTATPEEISLWHASVNCHMTLFLSRYDLSTNTYAYDAFQIGVDSKNHALTFALNKTDYMKIDLKENNIEILDWKQAEAVLRKVTEMRFSKVKNLQVKLY